MTVVPSNPAALGALDDGRPRAVAERVVVLDNRAVGVYRHLLLKTGPVPAEARPGQFVAVAVGADPGAPTVTLLRRAFSLHRASPDGPDGPTIEIVVAPHGQGSTWVARRRPGEELDLVGPLGRPFPDPEPSAPVVLVGGGYGSAPMGWWARVLRQRGHSVAGVFGAGEAGRLFGVADAAGLVDPLLVTTDDGSAGVRGRVTDVLPSLLVPGAEVYACGPMAMLNAVTAVAAEHGARAWCMVEESMACGIGVCMTCVLPVTWDDGVTRMTRTCVEGPTVDGAALRWDAIGGRPPMVPARDRGDLVSLHDTDSPRSPPDLASAIGTLPLANPVLTASGCAAAGRELGGLLDITGLGAVVTKSIMRDARSGRPTPRMAETPSGMLNSIGLQGPGIDAFLAKDLPWLREAGATAIVSIAGNDAAEFAELAGRLAAEPGVGAIEVNISCPNVANRGLVFACEPFSAAEVVRAVVGAVGGRVPVLAKLSPDVTDLVVIARAVLDAGADGLAMINTTLGMVIDTTRMRPMLAGLTGGLSGPAIRPIAVRCVWQVHAAMRAGLLREAPIVGIGGIRTGLDALEFVLAGACAVQVGTATFHDPTASVRIVGELAAAIAARGFDRFTDAVGHAHTVLARELEDDPR